MSYLFPIKPIENEKNKNPAKEPVERINNEEKELFSNNQEQEFKQKKEIIDEKIKKAVLNEKSLAYLGVLMAISKNEHIRRDLLELSKLIACSVLKLEMTQAARNFFNDNEIEEILSDDKSHMTLSQMLSKMVINYSKIQKKQEAKAGKEPKKNYGKAYPLLYNNAGFLVHYCKEILEKKMN